MVSFCEAHGFTWSNKIGRARDFSVKPHCLKKWKLKHKQTTYEGQEGNTPDNRKEKTVNEFEEFGNV